MIYFFSGLCMDIVMGFGADRGAVERDLSGLKQKKKREKAKSFFFFFYRKVNLFNFAWLNSPALSEWR